MNAAVVPQHATASKCWRGETLTHGGLRTKYFGFIALLAFSSLLFLFRLGDRELASSHEARAAQNSQSILNSGQWDLPRLFDGRVEMQKPPLFYWLVAALGWLKGGQIDAW